MNSDLLRLIKGHPSIDELLTHCDRIEFVSGHGRVYMFVNGSMSFQGLTAEDCIREFVLQRNGDRNAN